MKKFTLFLLTFLLFVGFINVNAQYSDGDGGPTTRVAYGITGTAPVGMYCLEVGQQAPVDVFFQVGDNVNQPNPHLQGHKVYKTTDETLSPGEPGWTQITTGINITGTPGNAAYGIQFHVAGDMISQTTYYYAEVMQEIGGTYQPLLSGVVTATVVPKIFLTMISPNPIKGFLCEGFEQTFTGNFAWVDENDDPIQALRGNVYLSYEWTYEKDSGTPVVGSNGIDSILVGGDIVYISDYDFGPAGVGTYDVTYKVAITGYGDNYTYGCEDTKKIDAPFTIRTVPTPTITGNGAICGGTDGIVTVGTNFHNPDNDTVQLKFELYQDDVLVKTILSSYMSSNPIAFDSINTFTLSAGEYEYYTVLSIINKNGIPSFCEATSSTIEIEILPYETPVVSIDDAALCIDETHVIEPTVTGGTGNYTYVWTRLEDGSTSYDPTFPINSSVAGVQTIILQVLDNVGSQQTCPSNTDTAVINVLKTPTKAFTRIQSPTTRCDDGTGSFTFNMIANSPDYAAGETGLWTVFSGNAEINEPSNPATTIKVNVRDTAKLVWTISTGASGKCGSSSDTLTMIVVPLPVIEVLSDTAVCMNEPLIIVATKVLNGELDYYCEWNNGFPGTANPGSCTFTAITSTPHTGTLTVTMYTVVDSVVINPDTGEKIPYICTSNASIAITVFDSIYAFLELPVVCANVDSVDITGTGSQKDKAGNTLTGGTFKYEFFAPTGGPGDAVKKRGDKYYYYPALNYHGGYIRYTYIDANGCEAYADEGMENAMPPEIEPIADIMACANDREHTIDVDIHYGTQPFTIEWNGVAALNGEFIDSANYKFNFANVSTTDTIPVTIKVTDDNGCVDEIEINIKVNPIPELIVPADMTACGNGPDLEIVLTPKQENVVHSYTIYNPDNTANTYANVSNDTIIFPTSTMTQYGTYIVEIRAMNTQTQCGSRADTVKITLFEPPTLTPLTSDTTVCVGSSIELVTWAMYPHTPIAPPGNLPYQHDFRFIPGYEGGGLDGWENYNEATANRFSVIPYTTTPGAAMLEIFVSDKNGCVDTVRTFVTVVPRPEVTLNDVEVCFGAAIQMTAFYTPDPIVNPLTWTWESESANIAFSTGNTNPPPGASIRDITYTTPDTTTVTVTVTDGNGCSNSATANLIIHPLPDVQFDITMTPEVRDSTYQPWPHPFVPYVCEGTPPFRLAGGSPAGGVYSGPGVTTTYITPTSPPFYHFNSAGLALNTEYIIEYRYTDPVSKCAKSAFDTIILRALPTAAISYPPDTFCVNYQSPIYPVLNPILFGNLIDYVFSVDPPTGLLVDSLTGAIDFTDATPGTYRVWWHFTDIYCTNDTFVDVVVRERPTVTLNPNPIITCLNYGSVLVAAIPGGEVVAYQWDLPKILTIQYPDPVPSDWPDSLRYVVPSAITQDTISVRVMDEHGCFSVWVVAPIDIDTLPKVTLDLSAADPPVMEQNGVLYVCEGTPRFRLAGGSPAGGVYSGTGVTPGPSLTPNTPPPFYYFNPASVNLDDKIAITYTWGNSAGCRSSATDTLVVRSKPTTAISYGQMPICATGTVTPNIITPNVSITDISYSASGELADKIDPTDGTLTLTGVTAGDYWIYFTFSDGWCENTDSVEITLAPQPKLSEITATKACLGQNGELSVSYIVKPNGTTQKWEIETGSGWVPVTGGTDTILIYTGTPDPRDLRVVATTPEGCTDTVWYTLEPVTDPIATLTIDNIASPVCNHSLINLNAQITYNDPIPNQEFVWEISIDGGVSWDPIGLTTLSGVYQLALPDPLSTSATIQFRLKAKTEGYNCPWEVLSNIITVMPSIEVAGSGIDTVCHGGSVKLVWTLPNLHQVLVPGNDVWYRIKENNVWYEGVSEVHMVEAGTTEIHFTTRPMLHTSEEGPQSYCYTVEVWQSLVPYINSVAPYMPGVCYTTSDCHMVTVLKDGTLTLSGPIYVQKDANEPPVFIANVIGGTGDITYEWLLNGTLVDEDGPIYTMDDPEVLGKIGTYHIAVRAKQNVSGCETAVKEHIFHVIHGCGVVQIVGPTEGCVGDVITLTAIVDVHENLDYSLQWKQGDLNSMDFIPGATGLTYSFIVPDNINKIEYQIDLTCGGCEISNAAGSHYFQVVPRVIVLVDNYIICENGAVEVAAEAITYDPGQVIYRYIWYNAAQEPIDTTYVNKRTFTFDEITNDITTFYVSVQTLNAVCGSVLVPFTITIQGSLEPVAIIATSAAICSGELIYVELGEDVNIPLYGIPTYSWWINGVQVPGESLDYLNIPLFTQGTHYIEAHLVYPGNNCEFVTDQITIEVFAIPTVVIAGTNVVCNAVEPSVLQAIVDPIELQLTGFISYRWFENGLLVGTEATQAVSNVPSPIDYIYVVEIDYNGAHCMAQSLPFPVRVEEFASVLITADKTQICPGEEVFLTAYPSDENNMTYQWYENGDTIHGETGKGLQINPEATATYTFTMTQIESGCIANSNAIVITVVEKPEIEYEYLDITICQYQQAQFSAFIAQPYPYPVTFKWRINSIEVPGTGSTWNNLVYNFNEPGTYYVDVQAISEMADCKSDITWIATVIVDAVPSVVISGPDLVCNAVEPTVLYAMVDPIEADVTYQWYENGAKVGTDATQVVNNVPSPNPYIYVVEITYNQCVVQSLPKEVTVEQFASVLITADKTKVCTGEQVILTAYPSDDNNMTYQWYENGELILNEDGKGLQINPEATATYTFIMTQVESGCIAKSNAIVVTVVEKPVIDVLTASAAYICEGGAVILTATEIEGAVYTWYRNTIIMTGATQYQIIDFPEREGNDATLYIYTVEATIDPGCTSALAGPVTVTVEPQLEIIIEGPDLVCENMDITLTGFVINHNPETGDLTYIWTLLDDTAQEVTPDEYLAGFEDGFETTLEILLTNQYGFNYTINPTYDGSIDANPVATTTFTYLPCFGPAVATSYKDMYEMGITDATLLGIAAGINDANTKATNFLNPTIIAEIEAVAIAAAIADAFIAGPAIYEAEGLMQGIVQAQAILTEMFVNAVINASASGFSATLNGLIGYTTAPNPIEGTYVEACILYHTSQIFNYKNGYVFGYKDAYAPAYQETYINAVTEAIIQTYVGKYAEEFAALYSMKGFFTNKYEGQSVTVNLPARDYEYNFILTAYNQNGCVATALKTVMVNTSAITPTSITMIPADGRICDGGQVELTAYIPNPNNVEYYYIWYENGIEIPGKNLSTIWVSPTTVGLDPTNYTYNVIAVPLDTDCPLIEPDPSKAKTVFVKRNPDVAITGQQHVCDIYAGEAPYNAIPNVSITAYVNGLYEGGHCCCEPGDCGGIIYCDYQDYKWYFNGAQIFPTDRCDAQRLSLYLPARMQPYEFYMEYDGGLGCGATSNVIAVTVHPQQVITILPEPTLDAVPICEGGSVTLRANHDNYIETDYVYQWYKDIYNDFNLIPGATEQYYTTPAIHVAGDHTYYVKVTQLSTYDNNIVEKCVVVESYVLTVLPKPEITEIIISEEYVCTGGQVTLTAIPSDDNAIYTWRRNGEIIAGVNGPTFTESLDATDGDGTFYTYNVTVKYPNSGCESVVNADLAKTVTVYQRPLVRISGNSDFCETDHIFLAAYADGLSANVGELTYTWYLDGEERMNELIDDHYSQFYAEPQAPRHNPYIIEVKVSRGNGCSAMSPEFPVTVHVKPVVNITASYNTICTGGSVELTANLNDYNAGFLIYQWYKITEETYTITLGDEEIEYTEIVRTLIPGATQRTFVTGVLNEASTFAVEVFQTSSRCIATDEITIDITVAPVVVGEIVEETICNGKQVSMAVTTEIDGEVVPATYKWFENGQELFGVNGDNYTMTATAPGIYTYEVEAIVSIVGCTSLRTVVGIVTVENPVTVEIAGNTLICENAEGAILTAVTTPHDAEVDYQWYLFGEPIDGATGNTLDISDYDATYAAYAFTVKVTELVTECWDESPIHYVRIEHYSNVGITINKESVCAGEKVELTAVNVTPASNMTFKWFANDVEIDNCNAPNCEHFPVVSTTYRFEMIQTGSECSAGSNLVSVVVIPAPEIYIEPDGNEINEIICAGEQLPFEVSSEEDAIYTWYINDIEIPGAGNASLFNYTFDQSGVFRIQVSATSVIAGCPSELILVGTITVKEAPTVKIAGLTMVCAEPVTPHELTAVVTPVNAVVTFQWYENGFEMGTNQTQPVNTVMSQDPYIYLVEITDEVSGCVVTSLEHIVYVNESPIIAIEPSKYDICSGELVTLTAYTTPEPNTEYKWFANGNLIPGANSTICAVYVEETTTFTFTAEHISGCKATSTEVTVRVTQEISLDLDPIYPVICQLDQVPGGFTAPTIDDVEVTYTWYIDGVVQPGAVYHYFNPVFNQYGIFRVQVQATTVLTGCPSNVVLAGIVYVKEAVKVSISGPTEICGNAANAILHAITEPPAAANVEYQWFLNNQPIDGATNATYFVDELPGYTYNYTVQVTSAGDCQRSSETHSVTVMQFLTVGATVDKPEICAGETVMLQATMNEQLPSMKYQWFANEVLISGAEYTNCQQNPTVTTVYYFEATQLGTECKTRSNNVTVIVTSPAQPTLEISDVMICSNKQVTVSVVGGVDAGYTWFEDGFPIATNVGRTIIRDVTAVGNSLKTYTYTAILIENGCSSIESAPVAVTVHPAISVELYGTNEVCEQADEELTFNAVVTPAIPGVIYQYKFYYVQGTNQVTLAENYENSSIQIPNTLEPNDPTNPYYFFVDVIAMGYGCTNTSEGYEVNILPEDGVTISVNYDQICVDGTIIATANTSSNVPGDYNYIWTVGGAPIATNGPVVSISNLTIGTHAIAVEVKRIGASNSCAGTDTKLVQVFDIPTLTIAQTGNICVGGQVTLEAQVTHSEALIANLPYIYTWYGNDGQVERPINTYTPTLSEGTYQYKVVAANIDRGCITPERDYNLVTVVPQPVVDIYINGYNTYMVCPLAEVEIISDFDPEGAAAAIQEVEKYRWNGGEWMGGPQIQSFIAQLGNPGTQAYHLQVVFKPGSYCNDATANLEIEVVANPEWTITQPTVGEICLGETVSFTADVTGGVPAQYNPAKITWEYNVNNGAWIPIDDVTGPNLINHKPETEGSYIYRAIYTATNILTNCEVEPYVFNAIQVNSIELSATFDIAASTTVICKDDPGVNTIQLVVDFVGTPPFKFIITGPGVNRTLESHTHRYVVNGIPAPAVTSEYTVTPIMSKCTVNDVVSDYITVTITDIALPVRDFTTCDYKVDIPLTVTSFAAPAATVTIGEETIVADIVRVNGNNYMLSIEIPETVPAGTYNVNIKIDGCDYPATITIASIAGVYAYFVDAPEISICSGAAEQVMLNITFTGTPPFTYMIAENGVPIWDQPRTTPTNQASVAVSPVVTSVYTIVSVTNKAGCEVIDPNNEPQITVILGNVEIFSTVVMACSGDMKLELNSDATYIAEITMFGRTWNESIVLGYNVIDIVVPTETPYGTYDAVLVVGGCTYNILIIHVPLNDAGNSLIHRRWEGNSDVLAVSNYNKCDDEGYYNGGFEFTSYQWYKNGNEIPGATQGFYQDPLGLNGEYAVRLTGYKVDCEGNRGERVEFTTCDQSFSPASSMKVYPVPARINEPVFVELDLTAAELEGALLDIYDARGAHIQHVKVVSKTTQVDGFKAQGTYFGRITTGTNEIKAVKFVIVK